ncbi:MAG: MMPL family transporter [Pseudomonadales bacterium]
MSNFEQAFSNKVIQWRFPIIILCLVLVALSATGGKLLSFTTNYRVFFSADNPQLLAFDALEKTYSKNDNVMLVLAPKSGNVFTPETLALVEDLTEKSWQTPFSTRVDSLSNFQHTEAEEDDLIVRNLVENGATLSNEELDAIKTVALSEPLLAKRLVSPEGHVTAVNITIHLPGLNEIEETPQVVNFVRALADDIRAKHPDMEVYLSGVIMMNNAFSEATKTDLQTLVPVSFALMLLILAIMVGGISGTLATLLVIAFSIAAAMGLGARLGYPLSPPSASAPTIILTIAIANCVHILASFLQNMQQGQAKLDALRESLRINLQPVFLACFTTMLGFLTLNFSDVPPFRHLGNFVAIGVVVAFLLSVTFLPALISLLPVRQRQVQQGHNMLLVKLGDFVVKQRSRLLWGTLAVIALLITAIPKNELNDVFVHYFDPSITFRSDTDFTTENLTGVYTIEYSIESDESGGINNPEFLREASDFADWYRQQPEALHINTYTDIMKRLNKNLHGDDEQWYRLPEQRELAAQYLLLYEMSLPYGLDLNNQINIDKSATRMIATLKTISTNELIALEQRVQDWLTTNAPHIKQATGSGTAIMFAYIGKRNIVSMLIGASVALVLISLILLIALRSVKIGLISLVPNLFPAAVAFGVWGLFVGEVGLSLSIVMSMTLGIVVDDTVHFLSKYLRARREHNMSSEDAVRYAFKTVGRALFTTTFVLVAGFLVLALSSFQLNAGMGLLTAIVIIIALAIDFLLLPPVLMKFEERKNA